MEVKVKIKKLNEHAVIPKYARDGDAGMDLTAISKKWDGENSVWKYGTGLAFEIPKGYVGLLFPRSSVYKQDLSLSNSVGVLDSGFRGEVSLNFNEVEEDSVNVYEVGDRVGQLIIIPFPQIEFEEVDSLETSERGDKGFGSTNLI